MIGGYDIIVSGVENPVIKTCEALAETWPNALIRDANRKLGSPDNILPISEAIKFVDASEIFIYQDQAAKDSWDKLGADPSNTNTMIYILFGKDEVTFVVDELDRLVEILLKGVRS
jgi:hypothetical protein